MSKNNPQDLRIRRTRKWLQEALLSLMLEKPFKKISIAEITEQAEVSRPTFYLHYRTKEEVLVDYLDSMYQTFMEDMQPYVDSILQGKMAIKLFEQIAAQATFLRSLLNSEVSFIVMERLHQYCYDVIKQSLQQELFPKIDDTTWDILMASLAGSVYAISIQWLKMDMPLPPKEMGELTMRLQRLGMREVLIQK